MMIVMIMMMVVVMMMVVMVGLMTMMVVVMVMMVVVVMVMMGMMVVVMAMMGMIVKQRDADAGDYTLAPESPAWLLGIAQVRRIISRQAGPDILIFSLQL